MAQIETAYDPGSTSTITQAPPPLQAPGSDLTEFYKELIRRRDAAQPAAPSAGFGAAPPQRFAARREIPMESHSDAVDPLETARRQDAMQELAYRKRLRDIDLNPPTKWIESRPGVSGGYAPDSSVLPLSMRPQNAAIQHGPQDVHRSQARYADDQAFQDRLDFNRARPGY